MKRNPLLRSILLTCACLLVLTSFQQALAQEPTTEGALLAVDAKGQPAGPCPLKHTDVKAEVSGFIARVTVTQQFQNPFSDKIEAVYTFPLPQAAAVDDMTIVIGDRIVKGKIMSREDAQATYDAAKARGQIAALLNQQRPNIFTQAVANILPGQQINVTISYVETLKYDEGSYEWHFPMVVGKRYIPGPMTSDQPTTNAEPAEAQELVTERRRVPDANSITPPVMPEGMRAGHDISIEVKIDAGVPLIGFQSVTHEIEAVQPDAGKAIVRLKDQATIPNRDFVLKYDVAGAKIEDALLFHRRGNEGFFTFILQPPQRVTAVDVNPKELVFVLDTSGSMSGFPIEKAKQTMMLALENLYPQDTFNVILFSGDTKILFSDPQPATPENIDKAKRLVASANGNGGTEMMKAIRAALDPSDASDHVRITCFMTDGQVGDDMEIIAEVRKHPRARVFAMGFGSAPNRFLLDKITEYGRGEVEYVSENGDAKHAAERFHERVRNPLLTDISIDWAGLPVTDVYPKITPDLFSAKPVVLSGRYRAGGTGVLRLKGMMAGHEFVREIPLQLPEQENQHDVLATLWARSKVDDLMGQDMTGAQSGNIKDELKTEITNLGLSYRLMTQFTSFVAVDDTPGDGLEPRRVDVPVESTSGEDRMVINVGYAGVNETVTVSGTAQMVQTTAASVSSTVTQRSISDLPTNGRTLQSLSLLAPGTVATQPESPMVNGRANISVNGQRPASNSFVIDGASGNFGIAPGGQSPGVSASGAPALTATGDTSPMVPFNAVQEVTIQTHSQTAEYGRNSGGIISVVTKAGTNNFHGAAFEFFGTRMLNANDWFANNRGLSRPPSNSNEFGGNFGGPIKRDQIFFFAAYEGLRLHQPVTTLTDVPSLAARVAAPGNIRPLLDLYPLPNGVTRPDGFAEFASSFANYGRHDSASLRVDNHINPRLTLGAYYNFTDSRADERGGGGFSTNTLNRNSSRSQMLTAYTTFVFSPTVIGDLRVNYSQLSSRSSYLLDQFGGAILPPASVFSQSTFASGGSFAADLNARGTALLSGADTSSTQRQFNPVGYISLVSGTHTMKFGADYRRMFPTIGLRQQEQSALFDGVSQALTGVAARIGQFTRGSSTRPVFNSLSAYAQDDWRMTSRLTLNYGVRWELQPAPNAADGLQPFAVSEVNDPAHLSLAPAGSRLWATAYGNLAPRAGVAYQLNKDGTFVVRGGVGLLYDGTNGPAGDAFADSYPLLNGAAIFNAPFSFSHPSLPIGVNVTVPFSAFNPNLKLPYSLQWSASVERQIGDHQVISLAYVGAINRRLLVTDTLLNPASDFAFVRLTDNRGRSDYRGLQLQFRRRWASGLAAMVNYSLANSMDNFSEDSAARALFRANDLNLERGPSDFDIRHNLSGFVSYRLPSPFKEGVGESLLRNWTLDSVFNIHSAGPVNVLYAVPTTFGFLYLRPDVVSGIPFYLTETNAAGGTRINPNAFVAPADLRQGTLGRNALRGFPLTQIDLALRRQFAFTESMHLVVGVEGSNILNHPNVGSTSGPEALIGTRFESTSPLQPNPTFGYSFTNAARSPWAGSGGTFGPANYSGGPRTLRVSVKFEF